MEEGFRAVTVSFPRLFGLVFPSTTPESPSCLPYPFERKWGRGTAPRRPYYKLVQPFPSLSLPIASRPLARWVFSLAISRSGGVKLNEQKFSSLSSARRSGRAREWEPIPLRKCSASGGGGWREGSGRRINLLIKCDAFNLFSDAGETAEGIGKSQVQARLTCEFTAGIGKRNQCRYRQVTRKNIYCVSLVLLSFGLLRCIFLCLLVFE